MAELPNDITEAAADYINTNSQSDFQKAQDKQSADKKKAKLKHLFTVLDADHSGTVNFEAFVNLLESQDIRLSKKIQEKLRLDARAKPKPGAGDKRDLITYREALRMIQPNLNVADPLLKEWVLSTDNRQNLSVTSASINDLRSVSNRRLSELNKPKRLIEKVSQSLQQLPVQSQNETPLQQSLNNSYNQLDFEQPSVVQPYENLNIKRRGFNSVKETPSQFQTLGFMDRHSVKWMADEGGVLEQKGANFKISRKRSMAESHLPMYDFNIVSNIGRYENSDMKSIFSQSKTGSLKRVVSNKKVKNMPEQKVERPYAMRARVVDRYINSVLDKRQSDHNYEQWVKVVEQIIRLNLDNRILNNLRQKLNEQINDERGLVSATVFRNMFFTFFKGEKYAYQVYDMLWPCIREYYDLEKDERVHSDDPKGTEVARIPALTQFIDLFNYFPVKVSKIRHKNDSHLITYIMNSGIHGTRNERGELILPKPDPKTEKERHLIELLSLVSDKIRERWTNFSNCFRFLDTNHTQKISLNEFCQAIEHMRLKISFEDIKTLFNYLDKNKTGELGYDEFTFLLEERWRGIDPIEVKLKEMHYQQANPMETSEKPILKIYDNLQTEQDQIMHREKLARNTSQFQPFEAEDKTFVNINRKPDDYQDSYDFKNLKLQMPVRDNHMTDLLKNDYHRKAIEQRIQRKVLKKEFDSYSKLAKLSVKRPTNASNLRSQSVVSDDNSLVSGQSQVMTSEEFSQIKKKLQMLKQVDQKLMVEQIGNGPQSKKITQLDDGEIGRQIKEFNKLPKIQNMQSQFDTTLTKSIVEQFSTMTKSPQKLLDDSVSKVSKQERDIALSVFFKDKRNYNTDGVSLPVKKVKPKHAEKLT